MKIEQAYNIVSIEILNVEDAYYFYWAGTIKDKKTLNTHDIDFTFLNSYNFL